MNSIAFVFAFSPHGTASGREGLDALLATSAFTNDIGVFFISDGVFQLFIEQKPNKVLARDYISTFKILPLYNIKMLWVCAASLQARGLTKDIPMVLNTKIVDSNVLREKLTNYNIVLKF